MMKKLMLTILALFIVGVFSGCSKTWSGIKSDSKSAWKSTKSTIHKATAD
jgi:predicted small secreted protein